MLFLFAKTGRLPKDCELKSPLVRYYICMICPFLGLKDLIV